MLALARSAALVGIEAREVTVEVDVGSGLPVFTIVGLPDAAVRESRERILAAFRNSGAEFPARRVTVNLAPADLPKYGSAFDLPVSAGALAATGQIPAPALEGRFLAGELGLDGSLRPVRGVLSMALLARERRARALLVPDANAAEAALVPGLEVIAVRSLEEAIALFRGRKSRSRGEGGGEIAQGAGDGSRGEASRADAAPGTAGPDFSEVRGQEGAKRALEVAVAGGHNVLLVGPPGAGKTMLARRIPSILPPLSPEEALETTRIHSAAGLLAAGGGLVRTPPFRAPHHTVSDAALVGGGRHAAPGEITLAHRGVLFLDELPEFHRNVLEALRQPLEEGSVTIARAGLAVRYPASFLFVGAMNLCPCGATGHPRRICRCAPGRIERYLAKVSGPLLDRIDLHVEVPPIPARLLASPSGDGAEPSSRIRERILAARALQEARHLDRAGHRAKAALLPEEVRRFATPDREGELLLQRAVERLGLSARAHGKVLRVARTIADLAGKATVGRDEIAEAIQYRALDRTPGSDRPWTPGVVGPDATGR